MTDPTPPSPANPRVLDLTLMIINDGDGTQCGVGHQERLEFARRYDLSAFVAMAQTAEHWRVARGCEPASRAEILLAGFEVFDYTLRHWAEGAGATVIEAAHYAARVAKLKAEGLTRSDAQACVDAEITNGAV